MRVRFSNAFGRTALTLGSVHVARSAGGGAIVPATDRAVTFHGQASVTMPEGALAVSDPVDFDLPPLGDVAFTCPDAGRPRACRATPAPAPRPTCSRGTPGPRPVSPARCASTTGTS